MKFNVLPIAFIYLSPAMHHTDNIYLSPAVDRHVDIKTQRRRDRRVSTCIDIGNELQSRFVLFVVRIYFISRN